jgi:YfiR/HmsC-like
MHRHRGHFRNKRRLSAAIFLAVAITYPLVVASDVQAEDVTVSDLEAATRALGFAESVPRDGRLVIGVVYAVNAPLEEAVAGEIAHKLSQISGPNNSRTEVHILATSEIASFDGRLDAIFLAPGAMANAGIIADAVRTRRLISISNDPTCIETSCCVLMVQGHGSVEIVLDTQLAEAAGAKFSSVFAMMVKRK